MSFDFDDICANNHGGNPQSEAAFKTVAPRITKMHREILDYLTQKPSTCEEVAIALGKRIQTFSARFSELKRWVKIKQVGTRPTTSGCDAAVFKVV